MRRAAFLGAATLAGGVVAAGTAVELPSGHEAALQDVVLETEGAVARFRFVLPAIARDSLAYGDLEADFPHLCEVYALPALAANGWDARAVVISLSDRETEFGVAEPEAVQFFEAFTVADGACIWDQF